jgi:hypothetical protein
VPKPVTVWAVELEKDARLDEVKGTLELVTDALLFTPRAEGQPATQFPLAAIDKVRRLRGSPVLMIEFTTGGRPRRTAFYFVQPPPLAALRGEPMERPAGLAGFRNPKRKARRDNVGYLGATNRMKKAQLNEWVREIRSAMAGGSSGSHAAPNAEPEP